MSEVPFHPLTALQVLVNHGVRFVLIGGYAANLRGSPVITGDLDLCYARDARNLERLAAALIELEAALRGPGVPEDLPFIPDAKTLELGDHFTFMTSMGSVDIMGTPAGTSGFDDLDQGASDVDIEGMTVRVASLDDLIRMKRAAARPRDKEHLEWLKALRDVIERGDTA
jgi:hypothetical protein